VVARILRKCASRAGVTGCSVRSLRHTLATNLLAAGANVAAVTALLGYSQPSNVVRNVTVEEMAAVVKTLE
jgi:site-specific recombinase XerD